MLFYSLPHCSSKAQPGRGSFLVLNVFLLYWLAFPTGGSEPRKATSRSPRKTTKVAIASRGSREPSVVGDAMTDRASRGNHCTVSTVRDATEQMVEELKAAGLLNLTSQISLAAPGTRVEVMAC
jgi:hypothetical protein